MTKNKVYLSIPMCIDDEEKNAIYTRLTNMGYAVYMWDKNSNTPYGQNELEAIKYCDYFIFMSPYMEFSFKVSELSTGVKKEFTQALNNYKNTKLCYKNRDGEYNFYEHTLSGDVIRGISTKDKSDTYLPDLSKLNTIKQLFSEEISCLKQKQLLLFF